MSKNEQNGQSESIDPSLGVKGDVHVVLHLMKSPGDTDVSKGDPILLAITPEGLTNLGELRFLFMHAGIQLLEQSGLLSKGSSLEDWDKRAESKPL